MSTHRRSYYDFVAGVVFGLVAGAVAREILHLMASAVYR